MSGFWDGDHFHGAQLHQAIMFGDRRPKERWIFDDQPFWLPKGDDVESEGYSYSEESDNIG
jgi:hypothetical protein